MDLNELKIQITAYFTKLQAQIIKLVQFVIWRLKNYGQMTLAEQIAYPCILLGITLIFASFILMLL